MNISSLVELIDGELKNPPSISFVYNIQTDINKLKNGDLFISNNQNEISQAVSKGAFGIVYDGELVNIIDKEIAWIKVADIYLAMRKIARYLILSENIDIWLVDEVSLEFFELCSDKIVIFDDDDVLNLQKAQACDKTNIHISAFKKDLTVINPSYKVFSVNHYCPTNITIHSIFESTFSYNGVLYSKVKIPFLYIDTFLSVIDFLDIKNPPMEIHGIKKWNLFAPIFINKSFKPIDFGKSDRFIISTTEISKALHSLSYIQKHYKYGKVLVLFHGNYKGQFKNGVFFNDFEELEFMIKSLKYNLLYIVGVSNEQIMEILQKEPQNISLFDL